MGIDPGFYSGSKVAVIDVTGKYIEGVTIYPHPPQNKSDEAKKILHHLDADSSLQYSYILIKNDISIDEYLMNILGRYIKVSKCKQDTLYDSAEVSYYVYYRDDYDWETPDKYAGTDWVSTPAQRAYDHQLDLDYGF